MGDIPLNRIGSGCLQESVAERSKDLGLTAGLPFHVQISGMSRNLSEPRLILLKL